MLDFVIINRKSFKDGHLVLYPDFDTTYSKDVMVRGHSFYAIWNPDKNEWSTDEREVSRLVDRELWNEHDRIVSEFPEYKGHVEVKTMRWFSTGSWLSWKNYLKNAVDTYKDLDTKVTFLSDKPRREDYTSKRLPYDLSDSPTPAYDELMEKLYSPEEREKLEWAIGSVFAGDSKRIQKFIVLYGGPGTGKGTVIDIIEMLFPGYFGVFYAKNLGQMNNAFALEPLKDNPLIAIDSDGKLDRITDNSMLNSLISHELITMNEKHKAQYKMKFNSFLFIASNNPVEITDSRSGILRRLIDVNPTGKTFTQDKYDKLKAQLEFELGGIANKCLKVYRELGRGYYNGYRPKEMMYATNDMYNFVESCYDIFLSEDKVSLKSAWSLYKDYVAEANVYNPFSMKTFREELKSYFGKFEERANTVNQDTGIRSTVRSVYSEFLTEKFDTKTIVTRVKEPDIKESWLTFKHYDPSRGFMSNPLNAMAADWPAQVAKIGEDGKDSPKGYWKKCKTTLRDISVQDLHYVKVPQNFVVIDFDIKDDDGEKSLEKNLEAASKWPPTYAELSKSGKGIHLHYIYTGGDPNDLSRVYDDNVEVKVFTGNSALRRRLDLCNDEEIRELSSGLPLKEKGAKVVDEKVIKDEKHLRNLIKKALNKETDLGGTKPNIDFIDHLLTEAAQQGLHFDVTDMRQAIYTFASKSSNHAPYCMSKVNDMKFCSEEVSEAVDAANDTMIVLDVEVYPNFNCLCWKYLNKGDEVFKCPFPSPDYIEQLLQYKIGGFNNRAYDNHIIYAMLMGYSPEMLFKLSQRLIDKNSGERGFNEARNLSEFDVYDFSSKKQSLKKWEIELGIHHQEMAIPWDQDVPEDMWDKVMEYCANDVRATEAVFNARKQDYVAREILADLSGLKINDTTRAHTTKIIFGNDKNPSLVYTDLSKEFPGYSYTVDDAGRCHSTYWGEDPGEGGYVYAEPGFYGNVALLDSASHHPTSTIQLNLFGKYTKNFADILNARIAIKHHDYDAAKKMLGGALIPYLGTDEQADALAGALKIVINSVYGFTTATFDNPFKDPRNADNIVAKRGALFMINLKHEVQKRGFKVAHIKTDSIKIPDATPEIIQFVMDYGKQYGYTFEHEATYDKMCLVNDAVYIARYKDGKHAGEWTATGTQFQVPYVFKTLFSHEKIEFEDTCETKSVTTAMYLDMNEDLAEGEHSYIFVGRVGQFCPIKPGCGGGELLRKKDDKYSSVTGTKGYRWLESETVKALHKEEDIDKSYYKKLVDAAVETIYKYVDFNWFASDDTYNGEVPFVNYMNQPVDPDEELPF